MSLMVKIYETNNSTKREPQVYVVDEGGFNVARFDVAGRARRSDPVKYAHMLANAAAIEQLAHDLLARLSYDYGDSEDCPTEVQALFDRGEELLPIQ